MRGSWSGLMDEDRNRLNCRVSPEGQCGTEKHECHGKAESLMPPKHLPDMHIYAVHV